MSDSEQQPQTNTDNYVQPHHDETAGGQPETNGREAQPWQPLRNWRWWLAGIAVAVAWMRATGSYGGIPPLRDDYYLAAFTLDLAINFAIGLAIYVGIPSAIVRWVRNRRDRPPPRSSTRRQRLAAIGVLIVGLFGPMLFGFAEQAGSPQEVAACDAAQDLTDSMLRAQQAQNVDEFSQRWAAAFNDVDRFRQVAADSGNNVLASNADEVAELLEQFPSAIREGDRTRLDQIGSQADAAMTEVATECQNVGRPLDY